MAERRAGRAGGRVPALLTALLTALLLAAGLGTVRAEVPEPGLFDGPWDAPDAHVDVAPALLPAARALPAAPVYHLELDLTDPRRVAARQEVRVVNDGAEPWRDLAFHLFPALLGGGFEIAALTRDGRALEPRLEADGTLLRVPLEPPLPPGGATVVALAYRLEVPEATPRNYGIFAARDGVLSLAHPYALLAVRGPAGWDLDPPAPHGDLAFAVSGRYRLRVRAPAGWTVVANGREVAARTDGDAVVRDFVAGPARDLYVAASPDYRSLGREAAGVDLRVHHLPGQEAGARAALDAAAAALAIFGERYGPYPYRELELVAVPTDALGVEFPGVAAIASRLLAEGPSGLLEGTVVHEVAHQWFYGLVGSDQVSEPWLDEALAQYLTGLYFADRYGPGAARGFAASLLDRWDRVGRRPLPIGLPATDYSSREYGAIVYGLGPLVLVELEELVGEAVVAAALRDYVEAHRFGVATRADLRGSLEARCGCDLRAFFEQRLGPRAP